MKTWYENLFYKITLCFNRGDNWAVITPMYKNWIPSCSLACDEFKYIYNVFVFYLIR